MIRLELEHGFDVESPVFQALLGQRVDLPVVAELGGAGGRQRADERAPPDARRHVAQLGEPPVDACGGEVVHADLGCAC